MSRGTGRRSRCSARRSRPCSPDAGRRVEGAELARGQLQHPGRITASGILDLLAAADGTAEVATRSRRAAPVGDGASRSPGRSPTSGARATRRPAGTSTPTAAAPPSSARRVRSSPTPGCGGRPEPASRRGCRPHPSRRSAAGSSRTGSRCRRRCTRARTTS